MIGNNIENTDEYEHIDFDYFIKNLGFIELSEKFTESISNANMIIFATDHKEFIEFNLNDIDK